MGIGSVSSNATNAASAAYRSNWERGCELDEGESKNALDLHLSSSKYSSRWICALTPETCHSRHWSVVYNRFKKNVKQGYFCSMMLLSSISVGLVIL